MIHSPQSMARRTDSTKSGYSQCSIINSTLKESQIKAACNLFNEMSKGNNLTIRYSQIKILMAINTIYRLCLKLKQKQLNKYLNIVRNFKKLKKQKFSLEKNDKYQTVNQIFNIARIFQRQAIQQIRIKARSQKGALKIYRLLANRTNFLKFNLMFSLRSMKFQSKSLIDELSCISYCNNEAISKKEKLAIQFASTTLIIYAINKVVTKQKLRFFISLNQPDSHKSISSFCLTPQNNNKNEFDTPEKKFRGACLLNQILQKKIQQYLNPLRIPKIKKRYSLAQSILQSHSISLTKLIKLKDSDGQQSTNDTVQSKKDYEEELELINNKIMTQTQVIEPKIYNISQFQNNTMHFLEGIDKSIIFQKKKYFNYKLLGLLWIILIAVLIKKLYS